MTGGPPKLGVGLMSGTSFDGMDAALVRFQGPTAATLLAFAHLPYDTEQRAGLERAIGAGSARELALLHAAIGRWAVDAVNAVLRAGQARPLDLDFIAFPGQTIWHEPPAVTWQLGEPAILAEELGVRVVSNFRSRDVAAGGQGAPLVPLADVLFFGAEHPRVLLNIGGMANLPFVPYRAREEGAFAFDTGPGIGVIDAVARAVDPTLPFDRDGQLARRGRASPAVLDDLLRDPFFAEPPPKSTGRERFGAAYAAALLRRVSGPDAVTTAVALTARSIADAVARWVPNASEVVVSGGGRRHPVLLETLRALLDRGDPPHPLRLFDDLFFSGDAKEAVAFALLGYLTLQGQPGNLPAATGARGTRVLGSVTPA